MLPKKVGKVLLSRDFDSLLTGVANPESMYGFAVVVSKPVVDPVPV